MNDELINKIFKTKNNGSFKVLDKELKVITENNILRKRTYYKIKFIEFDYETFVLKKHILSGNIWNPLFPNKNGFYFGLGKYNKINSLIAYTSWNHLQKRIYDINDKDYNNYKNIIVCDEWLNFQNFAAWYEENSKWNIFGYDLQLDKDILFNVKHLETKIYSPETCLLIPADLNAYLAGDNLKSGIKERSNKYQAIIGDNNKHKSLGTFYTFKEAKQVYSKEKYIIWKREIEKYNLPMELEEILLKYDFSWNLK